MKHSARTLEVFRTSYTFTDGLLHPGEHARSRRRTGRGAGRPFPYSAAYLPVNRLTDGTMHDW